ncbi:GNAT family N-acetyltransferase [Planococcus sp. N028]|uniref:GNAT family N-acetyltransferase n=1 Tax=Planococcus shixiaomingii TaxID=3058393 RepID=A0ABT8N6N5_9BACL|nr:GNAT family N-acetyltransferase [Planococcus sp. N028]MDN7243552.1 GNAT family N-acetyltransferase [Planococcus sp. N028]
MEEIKKLTTQAHWLAAFSVLKELRADLTEELYLSLLQDMQKDGYEMYALYSSEKIAAVIGFSWRTNFYNKRHVYVYDLVTAEDERSKGFGEKLLSYIEKLAIEGGASYIALESGIQRLEAHRFYEDKLNFDKFCFSFRKEL